jgi:hypothetical protein
MSFFPFILSRARRHWGTLLALSLGVVLATALLSSAPLLVDAVIDLGLKQTLSGAAVAEGNLRLTAHAEVDQAGFQALDGDITGLLRSTLGDHLGPVTPSAGSGWTFPWLSGQQLADQRVNLLFYEGIQEHLAYLGGEWPGEPSGEPNVVRAVVSDEMARAFALRPGDRLPVSFQGESAGPDAWIEVTGVVQPRDPRDPFWFGEFNPLRNQRTQRWSAQYSAIVPAEAFFPAVDALFPSRGLDLAWGGFLQHDRFSVGDIVPFQGRLAALRSALRERQPRVTLNTGVDAILASFEEQLASVRAPLYILVAEVVVLVLYYVTMVAALQMRDIEREFAILRSRGASGWQVFQIQALEAASIVAVTFLSGPVLGVGLVKTLSSIGPLADVGQVGWGLSVSRSAWLAAGAGTLACLAGLLLPVGPALRRSIVTHQQAVGRSTRRPWWQRFYLDVFILLVGLALLWRLRLYGNLVAGGARVDWLLLLSPLILMLGTATILLRVLPLLLRMMALLAGRVRGLVGVLALWQAARNPTHVARLILLLTLAIALGILATGLGATLDQSEIDRAHYLAGDELRLVSRRAIPLGDLESMPGVLRLSGVWRGQGTVDLKSTRSYPAFDLLAIEPRSFVGVTTFRDDFADVDMGALLDHLAVEEGQHPSMLLLPGQAAELGLWVWAAPENKADLDSIRRWIDGDNDAERIGLVAKLQTAQGELFTVRLQRPETTEEGRLQRDRFVLRLNLGGRDTELHFRIKPYSAGWHYFETRLPVLPPSSYPLSLHSLWLQNQATWRDEPIPKGMFLVLDDLTVVDAATGAPQIVESFENPEHLWSMNYVGLVSYLTKSQPRTGEWGLALEVGFYRPDLVLPLRFRQVWKNEPVPALASPTLMETTALQVGDVLHAWVNSVEVYFRIAGTLRYFPTMYQEQEAGYLVTSRDLLLALLNATAPEATNVNEVLVETDAGASREELVTGVPMLSASWEAESVRRTLKVNPLSLGLRGVTFFGYTLTGLLSLVGFASYFYNTIRRREVVYGVMRAMGLSPRQLYGSMMLEQVVLILAGLALGTGLGVLLNRFTLPRLPVTLGDRPPVPPFVPREDWLAVGQVFLVLAVAFFILLAVVTVLLWRARVHRILRIGQE